MQPEDMQDPSDPENTVLGNAFKSTPFWVTIIGVVATAGPLLLEQLTKTGVLQGNGVLVSVIGTIIVVATYIYKRLGAKTAAIDGAAAIAVAREQTKAIAANPTRR